jgi:hypothetical protein
MTASCKSDANEADSYTGQLVSGETVSCLTESEINASESLLQDGTVAADEGAIPGDDSEVQVSSTQYGDQEDPTKNDHMLDGDPVDEHAQSMENPEDGQVVTSSDSQVEQSTE